MFDSHSSKNLLESRLAALYLLLTAGFSPRFRAIAGIWGPKNARD
jgi:hypothetical protein